MFYLYVGAAIAVLLYLIYRYAGQLHYFQQREAKKQLQIERNRRKVWMAKQKELAAMEPKEMDEEAKKELRYAQITNAEIQKKKPLLGNEYNPLVGDTGSSTYRRPMKKKG